MMWQAYQIRGMGFLDRFLINCSLSIPLLECACLCTNSL